MTNTDEAAFDAMQNEYDGLDIPVLSVDSIILALTELMPRDEVFAAFDNAADWGTPNKNATEMMISVILDNAIDSSLQIAHIRRGMELNFEMAELEESLDNESADN